MATKNPPFIAEGRVWILATTYSHMAFRHSTIGAAAFHFRVRNGAGWGHCAMITRLPPAGLFNLVEVRGRMSGDRSFGVLWSFGDQKLREGSFVLEGCVWGRMDGKAGLVGSGSLATALGQFRDDSQSIH